jgi:hypothetical protein
MRVMKFMGYLKSKLNNRLNSYSVNIINVNGNDTGRIISNNPLINLNDNIEENTVVEIKAIPANEYDLEDISIIEASTNNKINCIPTYECNHEYYFKMPSSNITIFIEFKHKGEYKYGTRSGFKQF